MKFERPTVIDYGSITHHTFYNCPSGTGTEGVDPPKNVLDLVQDKFGECSHS